LAVEQPGDDAPMWYGALSFQLAPAKAQYGPCDALRAHEPLFRAGERRPP